MTRLAVTMLAGLLLLSAASVRAEEPAKPRKVSCKEIRAALASGKTPEQVASDLRVRPKRVKVCASGRQKAKKAKGARNAKNAAAGKASPAQPTPAKPTPAK